MDSEQADALYGRYGDNYDKWIQEWNWDSRHKSETMRELRLALGTRAALNYIQYRNCV